MAMSAPGEPAGRAFCPACGMPTEPGGRFCASCGSPVAGSGRAVPAAPRTSGKAIASLALAIAGFFLVPLLASVLAIVLGGQARREIEADPTLGGDGLAQAGVILGWIGGALSALFLLFFLSVV